MASTQTDMLCIRVNEYYNHPEYYRYMPEHIFCALEAAFLSGSEMAEIPEKDFLNMIFEKQINDKSQLN